MSAKGQRWPSWLTRPHGTPAAYRRHLRQHTRPCDACRQAEALRKAGSAATRAYEATRRDRYQQARAAGLSSDEAIKAKNSPELFAAALAERTGRRA